MMAAKTKSELLAEAEEVGAPVDDSNTVTEIQEAIDKAKAEDAEDRQNAKDKAAVAAAGSNASPAAAQSSGDDDAKLREQATQSPAAATPPAAPRSVVQGAQGNVYELGHNEAEPDAADLKAAEGVDPDKLPRSVLLQLKGLIDGALGKKGSEPARPSTPNLDIIVGAYPINEEAMGRYSSMGAVAAKFDGLKEDEIASFAVRQQRNGAGQFMGDQYLRVVTHQGKKKTVAV